MKDIVINNEGTIIYEQWRISYHALSRYVERIGGDLGNMVMDLKSSWLPMKNGKKVNWKMKHIIEKAEKQQGYILTNGEVLFLIKQSEGFHYVVTCFK